MSNQLWRSGCSSMVSYGSPPMTPSRPRFALFGSLRRSLGSWLLACRDIRRRWCFFLESGSRVLWATRASSRFCWPKWFLGSPFRPHSLWLQVRYGRQEGRKGFDVLRSIWWMYGYFQVVPPNRNLPGLWYHSAPMIIVTEMQLDTVVCRTVGQRLFCVFHGCDFHQAVPADWAMFAAKVGVFYWYRLPPVSKGTPTSGAHRHSGRI